MTIHRYYLKLCSCQSGQKTLTRIYLHFDYIEWATISTSQERVMVPVYSGDYTYHTINFESIIGNTALANRHPQGP